MVMLKVLKRGKAPVMRYECDWCGTEWIASVDEYGVEMDVVMGVSYPRMHCPVCKIRMRPGKEVTTDGDED
jgi:CRISPR/Cas system-associated protein Cas10 (large subunit of type III CRISPR-Cas system)